MNDIEPPAFLSEIAAVASWPIAALTVALILALVIAIRLRRTRRRRREWLILDGSNILYWKDKTPRIDSLHGAIRELTARGYTPGVVFDANAGYLVAGRYLHHDGFAKALGIPVDRVMVVPKGEPADDFILRAARELGARIVTNDRYRDWAETYPEVASPGYLIRGGYEANRIWFDLDTRADQAAAK